MEYISEHSHQSLIIVQARQSIQLVVLVSLLHFQLLQHTEYLIQLAMPFRFVDDMNQILRTMMTYTLMESPSLLIFKGMQQQHLGKFLL
jgi:hypothetical protein